MIRRCMRRDLWANPSTNARRAAVAHHPRGRGPLWHAICGVALRLAYLSTPRLKAPCSWCTTATRGRLFGESRHSQYTAPQSALRLTHHSDPGEFGGMKNGAPAIICRRALLVHRLVEVLPRGVLGVHGHGLEAVLHPGVGIVLVAELLHGRLSGDAHLAGEPAVVAHLGETAVYDHEHQGHGCDGIAPVPGNLVHEVEDEGHEVLHPHQA